MKLKGIQIPLHPAASPFSFRTNHPQGWIWTEFGPRNVSRRVPWVEYSRVTSSFSTSTQYTYYIQYHLVHSSPNYSCYFTWYGQEANISPRNGLLGKGLPSQPGTWEAPPWSPCLTIFSSLQISSIRLVPLGSRPSYGTHFKLPDWIRLSPTQ